MSDRILIDTSAWIEFFRNAESSITRAVDQILAEDLAAIPGVVVAEILQGARTQSEFDELQSLLEAVPLMPEPTNVWIRVAKLGFTLRRAGISGIGIPDMLIALIAVEHNLSVLTIDKHFEQIATVINLRLFE